MFPTAAPTFFLAGDDPEDAHLNALLQDNVILMNAMRSNLMNGKLDDNFDPMGKFRDNCNTVVSTYVTDIVDTLAAWSTGFGS